MHSQFSGMTEPRVVTYEDALGLLKRQVEKKGADYVYTDHYWICTLADPNPVTGEPEPRCIVGHVYVDIGVPAEDLVPVRGPVGRESVDLGATYGVHFEPEARALLLRAQENQDHGSPWGDAVRDAEAEVKGSPS